MNYKQSMKKTQKQIEELLVQACNDSVLSTRIIRYLAGTDYYTAPASTKHHLSIPGGLALHSLNVANALINLTDKLSLRWDNPRSPALVGLLHDLCKTLSYGIIPTEKGQKRALPKYMKIKRATLGHGEESLYICASEIRIELTEEESMCIRWHMGSFDAQENWSKYTDSILSFPNVLYTHLADMEAAHIMEKV